MNDQWPFEHKSNKTPRSPTKPARNARWPTVTREDRTRSQSITRLEAIEVINTEANTTDKPEARQPTQVTEVINKEANTADKPEARQSTQIINTEINIKNKMNQQQIQQSIASFVPEFSGEDTSRRANDLTRFIGTADSIYETLTTDNEKKVFDRLIKLRLTGDAYIRISHREVAGYPSLRDILNHMYSKSYSLEQLEKGFTQTQQSYGESVRNYGYRLMEALEQYKSGYKSKYEGIDDTYSKHLNSAAIQAFKRGINNVILKEKIATIKAQNIDDIISETEIVESMLASSITPQHEKIQQAKPPNNQTDFKPYSQPRLSVICNFCQRPNHTWDICRTRMNQERLRQLPQTQPYNFYNTQTQRSNHQNFQPQNTHQIYQPNYNRQTNNYVPPAPRNYQNNMNNQPNRNINPNSQPVPYTRTNPNRFPQKYCSHCKVTTGHTFEECRSKFFSKNQNQPSNQNNPSTSNDAGELSNRFNNMRINTIHPQPMQNQIQYSQHMNQENSNRSDQS